MTEVGIELLGQLKMEHFEDWICLMPYGKFGCCHPLWYHSVGISICLMPFFKKLCISGTTKIQHAVQIFVWYDNQVMS